MDESCKKKKGFDARIAAIKMAAVIAANKSKAASADAGRIEKSISKPNTK